MERKTRIPTQKRALQKYESILSAAFKLFNEKGYYNITTADIAKEANVATGSVYSYFKDKKDIYMEVLDRIHHSFYTPTHDFWKDKGKLDLKDEEGFKSILHIFIKLMLEYHNFSKLFHDDLTALQLLDPDISKSHEEATKISYQNGKDVFAMLSIPFKDEESSDIFIHYVMLLVEDVCHKILFDDTVTDIDVYVDHTVNLLYLLMQNLTEKKDSPI